MQEFVPVLVVATPEEVVKTQLDKVTDLDAATVHPQVDEQFRMVLVAGVHRPRRQARPAGDGGGSQTVRSERQRLGERRVPDAFVVAGATTQSRVG